MKPIQECRLADGQRLEDLLGDGDQPLLVRGLAAHWPAVAAGRQSPPAITRYLGDFYSGIPVYTIAAPPDAGGRFFYTDDLRGLNFKRAQIPLSQVLSQLQASADPGSAVPGGADQANAFAIAVQAMAIRDALPGFEGENPSPLAAPGIAPTMWIGTRGIVAPHYDVHRNIACVVAGRRHFILYPPEQVRNLYPGPALNAPGGVPVSLVNPWNPDLERFPRYADAVDQALDAVLEPGDGIFIPALWWHGVAALEAINVLVNYWWGGIGESGLSPNDTLLHALITLRKLDVPERRGWREFFDYYVFSEDTEQTIGHLPDDLEDIVTAPSEEQSTAVRKLLAQRLLD